MMGRARPTSVEPGEARGPDRAFAAYLYVYLGCALLYVGAVGSLNYAVDPLQIYRPAAYPPIFNETQRHQNIGLARSYTY